METQIEQTCGHSVCVCGGVTSERGMETCTLRYEAGSSTQCSVKAERGGMGWEMGGRFKREETYVYL